MHPIIAVPCDLKQLGEHAFHVVGDKYVTAVTGGAGGLPWLVPALGGGLPLDEVLDRVDGVLLTGSLSNVEPHHYGGSASRSGILHDPARDATTLPLIRQVLARGMPLLGICRGFQEINVALGGELYQHVQEEPGMLDHRDRDDDPLDIAYGPAHRVRFEPGSLLRGWLGQDEAMVNSLHQQGIKRLAPGLVAEARADDGLIEAFRAVDSAALAYAVQWHPEWQYQQHPVSRALFGAFGEACRAYQRSRRA